MCVAEETFNSQDESPTETCRIISWWWLIVPILHLPLRDVLNFFFSFSLAALTDDLLHIWILRTKPHRIATLTDVLVQLGRIVSLLDICHEIVTILVKDARTQQANMSNRLINNRLNRSRFQGDLAHYLLLSDESRHSLLFL